MVITLTTGSGSKQFSMSKLARYFALVILVLLLFYIVLSNWLWVQTTDNLQALEESHESLNDQYNNLLGTQQKYKFELDELTKVFKGVIQQKDFLEKENARIVILKERMEMIKGERDKLIVDTSTIPKLKQTLTQTESERDILRAENIRVELKNNALKENVLTLDKSLDDLEGMLNLNAPLHLNEDRFKRLSDLVKQRIFLLNSIPNGLPVKAIRVSDGFGMRYHPIKKTRAMHKGIDYKVLIGTPIYAPADGIVEMAERRNGSGKFIKLGHNFGFETSYSHLSKYLVKRGEYVHKGQKIAESGNTGQSTGPHLHYELLYLAKAINPAPFAAWNIANFEKIFTKVESVKWASLKNLYPLNQSVQH